MTRIIKKVQDSGPGLRQKITNTSGALVSLYDSSLLPERPNVNISDLLSPQLVFICWACGSTKDLTTYHAAGGPLAICASCKNGGIK